MNVKEIKELIDLVARRGLGGLEIERAGFRLRIEGPRGEPPARGGARATEGAYVGSAVPVAALPVPGPALSPAVLSMPLQAVAPVAPAGGSVAPAGAAPAEEPQHVIKSPIVGTFYRSSNPDAEPYVKLGDRVHKGQTLCIVEAMKLMNEIESDVSGTLVAIYPQNAQPVEFGEKLFAVQTD